jgi:hypothetical protein
VGYNSGPKKREFYSVPSAMFFRVVCFFVLLSAAKAQWPFPFQQQIPPPAQANQPNGPFIPNAGFMPIGSNGLQPFDGFPYGNR